jgi:hypothetical protein
MYSASTKTLHTRSTECYKPKSQSTQGAGTPSRATKTLKDAREAVKKVSEKLQGALTTLMFSPRESRRDEPGPGALLARAVRALALCRALHTCVGCANTAQPRKRTHAAAPSERQNSRPCQRCRAVLSRLPTAAAVYSAHPDSNRGQRPLVNSAHGRRHPR